MRKNFIKNISIIILVFSVFSFQCYKNNEETEPPQEIKNPLFDDMTNTNLPAGLSGQTMDATAADMDNDGDLDIVLAMEFKPNILLINDGNGQFTDASGNLPVTNRDSEDIGIADFNKDGFKDIVFVSEDDKINELFFSNGDGTFRDVSKNIPLWGISNAVEIFDINKDGSPDILIGNAGPNFILINNGDGTFKDETALRLPVSNINSTQDLNLVDIDNDGDLDIVEANEGQNSIYINNGNGVFTDETTNRLPVYIDETREVISGDVDGDGDLDLFFANVTFIMSVNAQDRLLLNNGSGIFTDVTTTNLPDATGSHFTAKFVDLNNDGIKDIVAPVSVILGNGQGRYYAYPNDGTGHFSEEFNIDVFPIPFISGNGFDIVSADFNGDGKLDLFMANRATGNPGTIGTVGGQDQLFFRK